MGELILGYDTISGKYAILDCGAITTDANGVPHASLKIIGTITANNASIGTDNTTAPTSSTLVGGIDGTGKLQGLLVDGSGNLKIVGTVTLTNYALETGGNLQTARTDLDGILTNTNKIPSPGQAAKAGSVPVVLASDAAVITTSTTTTIAATDTPVAQSAACTRWIIQNNSNANLYVEFDATSSAASLVIPPFGVMEESHFQVTSFHFYTVAAIGINVANGIVLKMWA